MSDQSFTVDSNQEFIIASEVLFQRFEDNALLLDLEAERVYQLNDTGARIVELLSQGHAFGKILATLKEAYATPPVNLEAQAGDLIGDLLAQGLVVRKKID